MLKSIFISLIHSLNHLQLLLHSLKPSSSTHFLQIYCVGLESTHLLGIVFKPRPYIYVNIISHLNISSKKIVFIIKIFYACLEYCNNLTGVRIVNNSNFLALIDHSNPHKPYHKRISHIRRRRRRKKKRKKKVKWSASPT